MKTKKSKKEIEKIKADLLNQLKDMMESGNAEHSPSDIVELDLENQTCVVKFNISIVPEDDYIGFSSY